MGKIFISYRRDDAQHQADRLYDQLTQRFAREDVFMDVDNIPLGVNFVDYLDDKVGQCEILLALIGRNWLSEIQRRADDPKDFVRIEIASALKRGIPVIPVLFDGPPMPEAQDLPDDVRELVQRNGIEIRRVGFREDVARLVNGINEIISPQSEEKAELPAPKAKAGKPFYTRIALVALALIALPLGGFGIYKLVEKPAVTEETLGQDEIPPVVTDRSDGRITSRPTSDASTGKAVEREAEISPPASPDAQRSGVEKTPIERAIEAAQKGEAVKTREFRDTLKNGIKGPEMVVVPAGRFVMGSPGSEEGRDDDEGPVRTVVISEAFAVGKYEVTWAEWERCVSAGGCDNAGPVSGGGDEGWGKGSRPVINVSWEDAKAYVGWLSRETGEDYRLLSEAEWEYAARAGTTGRYSNNGGEAQLCDIANHADTSTDYDFRNTSCSDGYGKQTAPVAAFRPNAFGLHDMHGNVWEWVEDCYEGSYSGAPTNGSARTTRNCSDRVIRGGSWLYAPQNLRSANRLRYSPEDRVIIVGFRLARTLDR